MPARAIDRGTGGGHAPTRRQVVLAIVGLAAGAAALYVLLPAIAGLDETWRRLSRGEPVWLAVAVGFEVLSYCCYVLVFLAVIGRDEPRITRRLSYEITMAGVAATRLFAAAGAGGIALTAWALHRLGIASTQVATRLATMMVLLYGAYMAAVVCAGAGLWLGVLPGHAPIELTLIPAALALSVTTAALTAALAPGDLERRLADTGDGSRLRRWTAAAVATASDGVRGALTLVRTRDLRLLGVVGWWAFDVAVLWACFEAFGQPPPIAVVVLGYFVGWTANVAPVPGGVGSVDGGMIATFAALDVGLGLAIVAVLSYRALAFWLPTVPGALAYVQLRRRLVDADEQRTQIRGSVPMRSAGER